jgi:hypothetical protein
MMSARHTFTMESYRHMREHGDYSYDPATETRDQGRTRCALALARAEYRLRHSPSVVQWIDDPEPDTSWMDEQARAEYERGDTRMLACLLWTPHDSDQCEFPAVSLWGIHVSSDDDDPYKRVIAAELAAEAGLLLDDRAEDAEREHWAARDVLTVG